MVRGVDWTGGWMVWCWNYVGSMWGEGCHDCVLNITTNYYTFAWGMIPNFPEKNHRKWLVANKQIYKMNFSEFPTLINCFPICIIKPSIVNMLFLMKLLAFHIYMYILHYTVTKPYVVVGDTLFLIVRYSRIFHAFSNVFYCYWSIYINQF